MSVVKNETNGKILLVLLSTKSKTITKTKYEKYNVRVCKKHMIFFKKCNDEQIQGKES